jgi:hypothetical protein
MTAALRIPLTEVPLTATWKVRRDLLRERISQPQAQAVA